MRTWDWFYPKVLPDVLGCPEPTVDEHLRDAARRFCFKTGCWRADLDRILTRAGRADYDISYPDSADGVRLIGATLGGHDIGLEVADVSMARRREGRSGRDRLRTMDLRTATLMPTPAIDGSELRIEAVLQPSQDAEGVPDNIGDLYRLEIATGALASLLMMNKQPWTNPQLGGFKESTFAEAMARTQSAVWKGYSNTRPRARGMFF